MPLCLDGRWLLEKLPYLRFFTVMTSQSVVESFAAWKRVPGDMLEMYGEFAILQPILAKSLTSGGVG